MRWFKHMSQLQRDPEIADYLGRCARDRLAGYGFLMIVMEVVAENMVKDSTTASATFPTSMWHSFCGVHHRTFTKFVECLRDSCVIDVEWVDGKCRIEIPKLLKWRDEYSRKSGPTPDTDRTMSHQSEKQSEETETDTDADADAEREVEQKTRSLASSFSISDRSHSPPSQSLTLGQKVDDLLNRAWELVTSNGEPDAYKLARYILSHHDKKPGAEPSANLIQGVHACIAEWQRNNPQSKRRLLRDQI